MLFRGALVFQAAAIVASQQAGVVNDNYHLPLPIARCTAAQGCVEEPTTVTMDASWRWMHKTNGYENCFDNGQWSASACSNGVACASNCALEGVTESAWSESYGISQRPGGGGVRVNFKTGGNIGSRFYLLDSSQTYKQFQLKNREITFDVDVSTLPCGMNGAVYFSEMPVDGDMGSTNTAGAAYGTGYCDAQCPSDVKFISGEANSEGWGASETGRGKYGSCCAEMDLWEANKEATAFTSHPCAVDKLYRCEGAECKTKCDMPGCDSNAYRFGARNFYGPGAEFTLNTLKPFTIVTQFLTTDGTDEGDLSEVRRFYVQDGQRIDNGPATLSGLQNQTSLSDEACAVAKEVFGEEDTHAKFGGMKQMGEAIGRGMTLVLSLWDDGASNMHWLDSNDPADEDPEKPGVARGPCPTDVGNPSYVRSHYPDSYVDYYNVKYGELGSTVTLGQTSPPEYQAPVSPHQPPTSPPVNQVPVSPHQPPTSPAPATPPAPTTPPASSAGQCCHNGCNGQCKEPADWCAQSQGRCEGNCNGQWCVGGVLAQAKAKRQKKLRGQDHIFMQKLLGGFSLGKKRAQKLGHGAEEL